MQTSKPAPGAPQPRLLVVDPAVFAAEHQGFDELAALWPGHVSRQLPALAGDGPRRADGYDVDAVVVLGSAASVHDDHAWLADLSDWLRPIVRGDVDLPLLGVCFGHQLIAHLMGAPVGFVHPDKTKVAAFTHTEFTGGRLLAAGTRLPVIASHCERVERLPQGFVRTATRPYADIDAMEHETRPIFSVQFHPEARDVFAGRVGLGPAGVDETFVTASRGLLSAFCRLALRHRSASAP